MGYFLKIFILLIFYLVLSLKINIAQNISLIYPKNEFISSDSSLILKWNKIINYDTSQIQIDTSVSFITPLIDSLILSDNFCYSFLYQTKTYYWRIRGINFNDTTNWSDIWSFTIFNPKEISCINLWLKASEGIVKDSINNILAWKNIINPNDSAFQNDFAKQPDFINGDPQIFNQPAIYFNGINDKLVNTNYHKFGSMFIISKWDGTETTFPTYNGIMAKYSSADFIYLFIGNSGTSELYPGGNPWGATGIFVNQNQTLEFSPLNQYKIIYGKTTTPANFDDFLIGASIDNAQYCWKGEIPEIIAFDTVISDSITNLIYQYLRFKYAPPVNLGYDINMYGFCDTTLDAGARFTDFIWDTGNIGDTLQTLSVSQTGTYSVTVTDVFGFTSTDSVKVTYPGNLNFTDTLICLYDIIEINPRLDSNYSYLWSTGSTDSIIYVSDTGSYWVTITDDNSCSVISDTMYVSLDSFPDVVTLGNDTSFCSGNYIELINGESEAEYYLWSDSSTNNVLVIDTTIGNYIYSVTVTNTIGCLGKDTINVVITGISPMPGFIADTVCISDTTIFIDTSIPASPSSNDSIISWEWIFGDGDTLYIQNPSHLYDNTGEYYVTLNISSNAGCSASITDTVFVKQKPIADFGVDIACSDNPYIFTDISTVSPPDSIISWFWDFGNGDTSLQQDTVYTYDSSGNYTVSLIVEASNSCTTQKQEQIEVVDSFYTPGNFTLIYPNDNTVLSDTIVNFMWNYSENASNYLLQIATDSLFNNIIIYQETVLNNYQLSIINYQLFYWRVIAFNICNDFVISEPYNFTIISIENFIGINLWLKASEGIVKDSINNILAWKNIINPNDSAFQNDFAKQPDFINGDPQIFNQPAIYFNGINDKLVNTNYHKFGSMFIISKWDGTETTFPTYNGIMAKYSSADFIYLFIGNSGTSELYPGGNPWGATGIFVNQNQTLEFSPLNQYKIIYGKTTTPANFDDFLIGASIDNAQYCWKGEIPEIIAFDTVISDSITNLIYQYLRFKYAPPVNLGENIHISYGFCDTILDAEERFIDYIWSTGETTQTISANVSGQYKVTVTGVFGFTSTDSIMVYYNNIPNQISDTTICVGDIITWDTELDTTYTFSWQNSDTLSYQEISTQGQYYVQISDSLSECSYYTDTIIVTIDLFSQNASLGQDDTLCAGNMLNLNLPAQSYIWSTGETSSSIVLDTSGQYWISATNFIGCQMTDTVDIYIQGIAPTPGFSNNITCIGDTTIFNDTSFVNGSGNIISWEWDFGDSSSSILQNPTNCYNNAGIYNVSLTVETDSGCFNIINKDIYIHSLPVPNFNYTNLCSNTDVQFYDNTISSDGNIVEWSWDFDNGDTSIIQNPVNIFNSSGNYQIELLVNTEYGCSYLFSENIFIKESPVAKFSFSNICVGDKVFFNDNSVTGIVHPLTSWHWDFGNSVTSSDANPVIVFDTVGIYPIEFIVTSLNGCSNTLNKNLCINPVPVALFYDSVICVDNQHQFNDSSFISSGAIVSWQWDINQIIFTAQNPFYTFNETGDYNIQLIVSSDSSCIDTLNKNITVYSLPDASFSFSPSWGIPLSSINFTNNNDNDSYFWVFGNGNDYIGENPTYAYPDSGTYNITLTVTDIHGCIDSSKQTISVIVPACDIAVLNISKTINEQYLSISADIANYGNIPLEQYYLSVDIGNGQIKETVTEQLLAGDIITYNFNITFEINPDILPEKICVKAELITCTDLYPENNEYCIIEDDAFAIYNIYPNPFTDDIYIEISIPAEDKILIHIYDNDGRLVDNYIFENVPKGFNRLKINTQSYAQGAYSVVVKYLNQTISKKMVKK